MGPKITAFKCEGHRGIGKELKMNFYHEPWDHFLFHLKWWRLHKLCPLSTGIQLKFTQGVINHYLNWFQFCLAQRFVSQIFDLNFHYEVNWFFSKLYMQYERYLLNYLIHYNLINLFT